MECSREEHRSDYAKGHEKNCPALPKQDRRQIPTRRECSVLGHVSVLHVARHNVT
jgi:hypothetical protein